MFVKPSSDEPDKRAFSAEPTASASRRPARPRLSDIRCTTPAVEHGKLLWQLAKRAGTLELNTPYAYLLLASHFRETCAVAWHQDAPVGFVAAYERPDAPGHVFVWQIGVVPEAAGQGAGSALLDCLVARLNHLTYLEATVDPGNHSSMGLFRSFARRYDAELRIRPYFQPEHFPESSHAPEQLLRIGPFDS